MKERTKRFLLEWAFVLTLAAAVIIVGGLLTSCAGSRVADLEQQLTSQQSELEAAQTDLERAYAQQAPGSVIADMAQRVTILAQQVNDTLAKIPAATAADTKDAIDDWPAALAGVLAAAGSSIYLNARRNRTREVELGIVHGRIDKLATSTK